MDKIFRRAAYKALIEWGRDDGVDDLVQDLWLWYLERPGTREQFDTQDEYLTRRHVYQSAMQILAGQALDSDLFLGKRLYSVDSVREALHGLSSNRYLKAILPIALEAIQRQDEASQFRAYYEAIQTRYVDLVVPAQGPDQVRLSRALKALTDEINLMFLTSDDVGCGSRHAVFPNSRSPSGRHGDPTGDLALALLYHGDEEIELLDEERSPTGDTTTYRKEFVS